MDALPVVFHCFDETFGLNKFHRPLLQVNVEFLSVFEKKKSFPARES